MQRTELTIASSWDGFPCPAAEHARITLSLDCELLEVRVNAPYVGDPKPNAPTGSTDGLWEYEVVELFLRGRDEHYVELEFGPHGHYLALLFDGIRRRSSEPLELGYQASVEQPSTAAMCESATGMNGPITSTSMGRFRAIARIRRSLLPWPILAANAHAIRGQGLRRRHFSAFPSQHLEPNFHDLASFRPLEWQSS